MNCYKQWTEDNLTIDSFYTEPEIDYVQSELEDSQLNTSQESNMQI
jgi:hypothetical protein